MDFICQQEALKQLNIYAKAKEHSIIIEGVSGCGKTYLARRYADMLHISNIHILNPTVEELRFLIDRSYDFLDDIVVCIENLDKGVVSASYTILKFLEEPSEHIYIVVTCRDTTQIPDTISSRGIIVSVSPPTDEDIKNYIKTKYTSSYNGIYARKALTECIKTFTDADTLCSLSADKLDYIINLKNLKIADDPVKNTVWSLGHFTDKTECPIQIVMKYLSDLINNEAINRMTLDRLKDLSQGRISKYQVLTKFAFDLKVMLNQR